MNYVQKFWLPVVALTTWLATSIGGFITFPIKLSSTSNIEGLVGGSVTLFAAIACAAVMQVGKMRATQSRAIWLKAGIVQIILFTLAFSIYMYFQMKWTCQYSPHWRLVVGDILGDSCEVYLMQIAGMTEAAFPREVLHRRFYLLCGAFIATWMLLATLVVSLAKASHIRGGVVAKKV